MSEEMSEEMNVFWENSQKTCDLFSWKTTGKHVTILPGKTVANLVCVFQEKDNVFTMKTVGIKINFIFLFPRKTMNETGFLFGMQTDGIILLFCLFICLGNGLNVFQANIDFTRFLTLFSKKTVTIPRSECYFWNLVGAS
jgi:hypothetical protein